MCVCVFVCVGVSLCVSKVYSLPVTMAPIFMKLSENIFMKLSENIKSDLSKFGKNRLQCVKS